MEFERQEFEATQGLLEDVMTKQAGSVEKAILEAVMNSVDAGASIINIEVTSDQIVIEDDGEGLTESDVDEYFSQFGLKDDDIEDKEFGKFRMGRGQIFNFGENIWKSQDNLMVVNLNEDESTVSIDGESHTVDTSGLGFAFAKTDEMVDGCNIEVNLFNTISPENVIDDVKGLITYVPWLHDVAIYINGEEFYKEFDYDWETQAGYYSVGDDGYGDKLSVYNKGAFVTQERVTRTKGTVVTKQDLDVNFARNDIIDGDELWRLIKSQYTRQVRDHVLNKVDISQEERKWVIEESGEDPDFFNRISDVPLVEDVKGEEWSFEQLQGKSVSFASKGDALAEDAMEKAGVVMLSNTYAGVLSDAAESLTEKENAGEIESGGSISPDNIKEYGDVIDDDLQFEMNEIDDGELSKKRLNRLRIIRWVLDQLGFRGNVKAGWSKNTNVWMDGERNLYIHKNYLKETKDKFNTVVLHEVIEVAAMNGDTRGGREHDFSFKSQYWKMMEQFPEVQMKVIKQGNKIAKKSR